MNTWKSIFEPLIQISPTAKALEKIGQEHTLFEQVLQVKDRFLALNDGLKESVQKQEEILLSVLKEVIKKTDLSALFLGNRAVFDRSTELFIVNYLQQAPWTQFSEREIALFWLRCCALLSEGIELQEEELWQSVPSVKLKSWIDLGVRKKLEEVIQNYLQVAHHKTLQENHQQGKNQQDKITNQIKTGVCITGQGKSALLAFTRRLCFAQGETPSFDQVQTEWQSVRSKLHPILLIDDLDAKGRLGRWRVAEWLTQLGAKAGLLIWTHRKEKEEASSFSNQLKSELDQCFEIDLDELWAQHESAFLTESSQEPTWLRKTQLELPLCDQFRCLLSAESIPKSEPYYDLSDLDAYASLIGPVASLRVLSMATQTDEESLRILLGNSAWAEVAEDEFGGSLFVPPDLYFWRAGLLAGTRRAHHCAHHLIEALEKVYPVQERSSIRQALQRLSRLRGRADYMGVIEPKIDHREALYTLQQLQHCLVQEQPHPLVLGTLCGLGFDWAARGPEGGFWKETLHALQVAAAAADRLRDIQLAGRLLNLLGKIALQDGRAEMAQEALKTAVRLLHAIRLAQEASEAATKFAEATLLNSTINEVFKRLKEAEEIAQSLALSRGVWRARFRMGQIYVAMGQDEQALICWETLYSAEQKSQGKVKLIEAQSTMGLFMTEMAGVHIRLGQMKEAQSLLTQLQINSASTVSTLPEILIQIIELQETTAANGSKWQRLNDHLTQAIIQHQKHREIGTWLMLQKWRAWLTLLRVGQEELQIEHSLFSLDETRLGLELSVKVAVGARDRLSLYAIYQLLAQVYQALNQAEAGFAAQAMAQAWASSLGISSVSHSQSKGQRSATNEEAKKEVAQLEEYWSQTSLSEQIIKQNDEASLKHEGEA